MGTPIVPCRVPAPVTQESVVDLQLFSQHAFCVFVPFPQGLARAAWKHPQTLQTGTKREHMPNDGGKNNHDDENSDGLEIATLLMIAEFHHYPNPSKPFQNH